MARAATARMPANGAAGEMPEKFLIDTGPFRNL
jgi:hypothetical protein